MQCSFVLHVQKSKSNEKGGQEKTVAASPTPSKVKRAVGLWWYCGQQPKESGRGLESFTFIFPGWFPPGESWVRKHTLTSRTADGTLSSSAFNSQRPSTPAPQSSPLEPTTHFLAGPAHFLFLLHGWCSQPGFQALGGCSGSAPALFCSSDSSQKTSPSLIWLKY